MASRNLIVIGGGAAGFFAAIACAEAARDVRVEVLEKTLNFLTKVRISGGGRCNVTHTRFEAREFARSYPRGGAALIGPLQRFDAGDTMAWFQAHGVPLKVEADGRVFPITDRAETVVDCLLRAARSSGVILRAQCAVDRVDRTASGSFELSLGNGETLSCDRMLLATGGCRSPALGQLAVSLGHTLEPPVPSLFTFCIETPWLRGLQGVGVEPVEAWIPGTRLRERGPLLVTHWGFTGPAILRLSAWGARALHQMDYHFPLCVNWLPELTEEALTAAFQSRRANEGARLVTRSPLGLLPARLWEQLALAAGIESRTRWSELSRSAQRQLVQHLRSSEFHVTGKSLNKDEFVTCGGVRLAEVNFKTMESRIRPGLYFAGELLDIDGITGGFNFQAAWTTGWIAGTAIAAAASSR